MLPRLLILCGEDPDLKRDAIDAVRDKTVRGGIATEWVRRDGNAFELAALLNEAGTAPLFAQHTILVVEPADAFFRRLPARVAKAKHAREDSEAPALLKRFEARPGLRATVILVTSLKPKVARALGVGDVIACWPLEDREGRPELTRWTMARARTRTGKTLEPAAAAALLARTGNALGRVTDAIDGLALLVGERPSIAAADVEALVGPDPQVHAFALAEASSQGDAPRALGLLRQLSDSGERPEALCAVLVFHYRRLAQALARTASGMPPPAAAEASGVSPMFQAPFLRSLRRLTPARAAENLLLLRDADRRLKRGGGGNLGALEQAVVRLCRPSLPAR